MLASEWGRVEPRAAVGVAGHVDPGVGARVEPVEDFADAQAAQAVAALPQVQEETRLFLLLIRRQQRIHKLDEPDNREQKGALADRPDVFAPIPGRSITVGTLLPEVPAGRSAAHQEVASVYEEEHRPEQVEDMQHGQSDDWVGGLEVLVGILVRLEAGSAERVVP